MLSYLKGIWDIILSLVNLVVMLIESLLQALSFLPSIISSLTESVGFLPPVLALFASLSITFIIINYILGRQGG